MQKATTMLAVTGCLVAAGIALSFYGSMIITEDLAQSFGNIGDGETIEVSAQLDPANGEGVYVVQTESERSTVSAIVLDPSGSQIDMVDVGAKSVEEKFAVTTKGVFTLVVENTGEHTGVFGVIGHVPDTARFSVGVTGFYLLVAGLVGMGIVGIYAIKNRKVS